MSNTGSCRGEMYSLSFYTIHFLEYPIPPQVKSRDLHLEKIPILKRCATAMSAERRRANTAIMGDRSACYKYQHSHFLRRHQHHRHHHQHQHHHHHHQHHPVEVCPSCRAFFRRSVQSGYNATYFCVKDGSCQVNCVLK